MSNAKSEVWKYFQILKENDTKAECLLCPANIAAHLKQIIRGKTVKSYSTKPLWNHLEAKHGTEFKEAKIKNSKDEQLSSNKEVSDKLSQPTLSAVLKKKEDWKLEDAKSKEITKRICEMMALDCEPFSVVEREGFRRLLKHIVPQYPMPCRTHFSEKVMPDIFEKLKITISKNLLNIKFASFTTDIWTSTTNNESFISLTIHCISSDMKREIFVLGVKHFVLSHSGYNISEILNTALEEWKIDNSKIHCIVTDNAANMVSGIGLMGVERVGCFIHTLQLVIHDAIFVEKSVVDILSKSRKIVGHFSHSTLACTKLKELQTNLKIPTHKLIQDVSTRWNSTFYMLSRLFEQKQAVTAYAVENDIPTLTSREWHMVENMIVVLKPFEEMTKQASAEDETIAYVIPAVTTLNSYLMKRCNDVGLQVMKSELKKSIQTRFLTSKGLDIHERKCFVVATLLDPRFKNRFLHDSGKAESWVIDEMIETHKTLESHKLNPIQNEKQKETNKETSIQSKAHENIWQCFDEIANSSASEEDSFGSDVQLSKILERQGSDRTKKKLSIYKLEVEKFLNAPLLPRLESALLWWKQNGTEYPNLKNIALKYLCPPPSSVQSERLFSAASAVYTENRNRLAPAKAEKLIFMMKNMKIVNFNY